MLETILRGSEGNLHLRRIQRGGTAGGFGTESLRGFRRSGAAGGPAVGSRMPFKLKYL